MDTVVYKVHNIKSYPIFYSNIDLIRNRGKGKIKIKSDDPWEGYANWQSAYVNITRNLFFVEPYEIKKHVASSSNFITIRHDTQMDLVKIEFSVPKFIFANNVVEIIPGLNSKHRPYGHYDMFSLAGYWLKVIRSVIQQLFIDVTFGAEKVKLTDVEISRVDIAYNQIFPCYEDSIFMLNALKKVRLKKSGETTFHPFDFAVTFNNPRYYFKIYHKGKEFAKNGRNDLEKNYKAFEAQNLRPPKFLQLSRKYLEDLQAYADKILRYELECKNLFLNYRFNRYLKKKFIPNYAKLRKVIYFLYDENNRLLFKKLCRDNAVMFQNDLGNLNSNFSSVYYLPVFFIDGIRVKDSDFFPGVDGKKPKKVYDKCLLILKAMREMHETFLVRKKNFLYNCEIINNFFVKEDNKVHKFFLEIDNKDAYKCSDVHGLVRGNTEFDYVLMMEPTETNQKFGLALMQQCINVHNEFFSLFQFDNLPTDDNIGLMVRKLNETNQVKDSYGKKIAKMRNSSTVLMYRLLAEYGSFDELKKSGLFSRQTLYNWKKKLIKWGHPMQIFTMTSSQLTI